MALQDQVNGNLTDYAGENPAGFYSNAFSWEPKKQHQFIMSIGDVPAYLIKAAARPSFSNGEIILDHINVKRKVKGKTVWNDISITLYDPISPPGAQAVMEWIRLHHESATGRDGYSSFYKKEIRLHQLSPLGEVIEEWILKGAFITSAGFGTFDWSSDAVQEISMTLRYDWAFLNF